MGINIVADFGEDYKQFILLSIKKYFNINLEDDKYSYLKDLEPQDLYFQYLSNSKRIPPAKPRNVHLSKELINKHTDKEGDILVVGLGNIYVTPDSLRAKSSF